MDIEDLKTQASALVVRAAYHAAANFVAIFSGAEAGVDSLSWPAIGGHLNADERDAAQELLADFVRSNPLAPAEALFRYAEGVEFHGVDPNGFTECALVYRCAYETFATSLLTADKLIAAEIARLEVVAQAETIIPAAALAEKPEDTILEQLPDPLELTPGVALVQAETPAGFRAPTPAAAIVAPIGEAAAPAIDAPAVEAAPTEASTSDQG